MIRTVILAIDVAITTFMAFVILMLFGWMNPYGTVGRNVVYYWSLLIVKIAGIKVHVHGHENIDTEHGYIVAANHQHLFDIPIITYASKLNIRFAAKKELFRIPIFGAAMKFAGMVKIDRGNNQQALAALKETEEAIKGGMSLVLFPEGTRNKTDQPMLPFKKGAFMMSLNTHRDLLPVTVNASHKIQQGLSIKPIDIDVYFHPPISPEDYIDNRDQFIKDTRKIIESKLER